MKNWRLTPFSICFVRFKILFLFFAVFLVFPVLGQRGVEMTERFVKSISAEINVNTLANFGVENISDRETMILQPLDYRIDSIIQHLVFPIFSTPERPQRAFGYSFSGTGSNTRVTEERIYTYHVMNGDFSGQQSRRLLDYN